MYENKPKLSVAEYARLVRFGFFAGLGFWLATLVLVIVAGVIGLPMPV